MFIHAILLMDADNICEVNLSSRRQLPDILFLMLVINVIEIQWETKNQLTSSIKLLLLSSSFRNFLSFKNEILKK